jgi:type 1 glutamine amidotransferase
MAWYQAIGCGKTFYAFFGHDEKAWSQKPFLQLLENAVEW